MRFEMPLRLRERFLLVLGNMKLSIALFLICAASVSAWSLLSAYALSLPEGEVWASLLDGLQRSLKLAAGWFLFGSMILLFRPLEMSLKQTEAFAAAPWSYLREQLSGGKE
jgi:hypothetical protein